MAYPTLPEEAQKELDNVAAKYSFFIHTQQYPEAQNIITDLFHKMLSWQEKYGQRFHKGYAIHNIGYTLYLQNNYKDALKYFILAYIEDLLSADRLEEADETAFWLEFIINEKLLKKNLVEPLLKEADELTKIFAASRKTASTKN